MCKDGCEMASPLDPTRVNYSQRLAAPIGIATPWLFTTSSAARGAFFAGSAFVSTNAAIKAIRSIA